MSAYSQASGGGFTKAHGSKKTSAVSRSEKKKKKADSLKAKHNKPAKDDSAAGAPEKEQAELAVGPKAELRPREAGSKSEELASTAVENSYLASAPHQKDQNFCISIAEAKAEHAEAGMAANEEHVEKMLKRITAQVQEMQLRDAHREDELEKVYQQMRDTIKKDGGRWPARKDYDSDGEYEEACKKHFYAMHPTPTAPAQSPTMNSADYLSRRGLGMTQTSKQEEEMDPHEYMRIELEVRRCKTVKEFIEWWHTEPNMANCRQGLGKHGSKMTDNKSSQKCSQLFRGENKTFTPWK
jgi:hypothetical protein